MQIPQVGLRPFPYHLKAACNLHVVSVCGVDDTLTFNGKAVSLRTLIGDVLSSPHYCENEYLETDEGIDGVAEPEGLGLSCSGLTPVSLASQQCPGKMAYRLLMQQRGSWGNQSEHRDVWSLLPAFLTPGSPAVLFWCVSLPVMMRSKFMESLQPLVLLKKVARWVLAHSSVRSCPPPRIVVVAHVVLDKPYLAEEARSELSSALVEILGEESCELRTIFSDGSPSKSKSVFAEAAALPSVDSSQLSISESEVIINELHASMSYEKLWGEYALVRADSLCGVLRSISEIKGCHSNSLVSMVEVAHRESQIGTLHQSFQSADAVCLVEDYIRASVKQFRKENEFAPPAELEAYLNMAAQRAFSHLIEAGIHVDPRVVGEVTTSEVKAHVASASAATAQLENDRRHNEIHLALKGLLDALDVAARDVSKCL